MYKVGKIGAALGFPITLVPRCRNDEDCANKATITFIQNMSRTHNLLRGNQYPFSESLIALYVIPEKEERLSRETH